VKIDFALKILARRYHKIKGSAVKEEAEEAVAIRAIVAQALVNLELGLTNDVTHRLAADWMLEDSMYLYDKKSRAAKQRLRAAFHVLSGDTLKRGVEQ